MYALLAFTATLFVLTVVYATRRPNWLTLTGCAAAGTALLYSHVYGSFVFAGVKHRCADGSPVAQSLARCELEELGRRTGLFQSSFSCHGHSSCGVVRVMGWRAFGYVNPQRDFCFCRL